MTTRTGSGGGMRVAELAAAVGVKPGTVRYYEKLGLLPQPERTPAGYRQYDAADVDRLRFVQGAQRLGLRLADIRDLLTVRDTGRCPCEPAEHLLSRRMAEVDAEITRLTALRTEMAAMRDALPDEDCPPPAPGTWCPPTPEEVTMMTLDLTVDCCEDPTCPPEECGCDC
ncbi:heavy metal-responsive transcriptional regulator [Kineosporiaceae bacterium SCSIO 59966]|nr:heavy metal-responsive transcriptional regulator [Kineosporiaceae bacterium SCSIO 59966]